MSRERERLLKSFVEGLRVARGDRLLDVLGILGHNLQALWEPSELPVVKELLSSLVEILEDQQTDLALRGAIAETLSILGPVIDALILGGSLSASLPHLLELRGLVLSGYVTCFNKPTALLGRETLAGALRNFKPADDVLALLQKALTDPAASVRDKAAESLALISAGKSP